MHKRARVSLTLRLICVYVLRSLLPFLTFISWNITGRLLGGLLVKSAHTEDPEGHTEREAQRTEEARAERRNHRFL